MAEILGIDANFDVITSYGYAFRKKFILTKFTARWPQHTLHTLAGTQAVQPNVNRFLTTNKINFITAMGHGTYQEVRGFRDAVLWHSGQRIFPVKGTILHLFACRAGRDLGPTLVGVGASSVWGYQENFWFPLSLSLHLYGGDPATDTFAEAIIRMDCIVDISILGGLAATDTKDAVERYCLDALNRVGPRERPFLLWNFANLVMHGDGNAII